MLKINFSLIGFFLLLFSPFAMGQNPILKGYADAHMKIWNGRMYVSAGKDKSPDIKGFAMPNWSIYSSSDLVNWKLECNILPEETFIGKGSLKCWASDITTLNGKYYFYFSHGGAETGVLAADQPDGPYRDVIKRPLIPEAYSVNHEYDPTIFVEEDGSQYLIFGRDGFDGKNLIHYQIAKLNKDMVSFEVPRDLLTDKEFGFGEKNRARDHQYFHKYNGTYYLSCAGAYMTSANIYGPFKNERHTGQNGHSSFCEYNGQWYHMYEWTCEPFGNRSYRQVSMTYLHYKENGDMVDDLNFLQATAVAKEGKYFKTGVGNYDASWEKIEAEWYFKKEGALVKRESPTGGFEIRNIHNNDYLAFPNIKSLTANSTINFRVSPIHPKGGTIEIHQDSETGPMLGKCKIPGSEALSGYKTVSCKLKNEAGIANLYLVFKGRNDELLRLDWFNCQ
jgi:arabinoxylan arabinofuranohydrolase